MRPIDQLFHDANKAASEGLDHILINRAELRQLKDYELVAGTANPDIATFREGASVLADGVKLTAPPAFSLHVKDTLP